MGSMKNAKSLKKTANPFNPQFGVKPDSFVGRDKIINDFLDGLDFINSPQRTTVLTGLRGSGKTALLSDISVLVKKKNCISVNVTARDGLLADIIGDLNRSAKKWISKAISKIETVSVGVLGISFAITRGSKSQTFGFRQALTDILEELDRHDIGVVFTIDEVHNDTKEMQEFIIVYQHLIREERNVALLMAGLPNAVYALLNNKILTFFRRSNRIFLHNIDIELVDKLYQSTFRDYDRNPTSIVSEAAVLTSGYPYLVQLIGYYLWGITNKTITQAKLDFCLRQAKQDLFQNIHDLIYRDLSAKDREFIEAMCQDNGTSKFADVIDRMGVAKGYASKYRQRLLDSGLIQREGRGELSFTLPFMQEFVVSIAE
jgi:energy-coupling factor transporter ATP-binding protein EcfA2